MSRALCVAQEAMHVSLRPRVTGHLVARPAASASALGCLCRPALQTTRAPAMTATRQLRLRPPPPAAAVADSIRIGGLADIKAARIAAILDTLHTERGECSLEHLRGESDEAIQQQLSRWVMLFVTHKM